MSKATGGPAFPIAPSSHGAGGGAGGSFNSQPGMSLRDYFAAQALSGLIERLNDEGHETMEQAAAQCADGAYKIADAMLAERAK